MKRLSGLFVFLLLLTNVYSQNYFDKESVILRYSDGNIESQFEDYYYGFITKNGKYVLAYDVDVDKSEWEESIYVGVNDNIKRNLFLYRFENNKWIKSSNIVQTDFSTTEVYVDFETHVGYDNSYNKIEYKGLGNGIVKVLNNGIVVMFITNDYKSIDIIHTYSQVTKQYTCCDGHKNGFVSIPEYEYNSIIVFVPNGDKTYIATRFEPENKKTNYPELKVNELLKIAESVNEIKIDIWNKEICEPEEADSSIIHTYESGRTKEVFYKKKHLTTLRFNLLGTQVRYSGDFKLIKTLCSLETQEKSESVASDEVKSHLSKNGVGYESFDDDNLSLAKVSELREKFINGENQISYNAYSKHTFKMNFNAPCADRNRNFEPENINNGYRRLYFENSENVYAQSKVVNNEVVEVIYFHPDGSIYTIKKIVNGQVNGWVKFVDLENYVILEGEYRNDKLVGKWNTPVMGNFNVQDNALISQYPGVVNQMLTFSNFYYYDKDGRALRINGFAP